MRHPLFIGLLFLLSLRLSAQPVDSLRRDTVPNYLEFYFPHILAAEEASLFGDFKEATSQYAQAFKECRGFGRHYFDAAEAAARNLSTDTAYIWMRLAARNGMPLKSFNKSTAFRQYRKTEEWLKFQRDFIGLYRAYINTLNLPLRTEVWGMNKSDKAMRTRKNMRENYGAIAANDSINLIRIKRIVATKGFPGERVIGNYWVDRNEEASIDLVVQHLVLYDSAQTIEILRTAVERGEAEPYLLAYTVDMHLAWKGLPQRYGTFVGPKKRVYPLEDEENIDALREAIGLEPFDLYCIKNDLKYFFIHPPSPPQTEQ